MLSTKDLPDSGITSKPDGDQFWIVISSENVGKTVDFGDIEENPLGILFVFYIGDEEYLSFEYDALSGKMFFKVDKEGLITLDIKGTDQFGTELSVYYNGLPKYSNQDIWGGF